MPALYGEFEALEFEAWLAQERHYTPLIERVIEQTERRVCGRETVPATEKVVSVLESHTDIIKKVPLTDHVLLSATGIELRQ